MPRLFFALWPDEFVRARAASVAEMLPPRLGKRVPVENLHTTLLFLGEVEAAVAEGLLQDASRVRSPPFQLVLDHTGWWRRPRVAWLGAREIPPELVRLVDELGSLARARGLQPEERSFHAHLTLARKVPRRPRTPSFVPIQWQINEFCLAESRLQQGGPEYLVRGRWPLTCP